MATDGASETASGAQDLFRLDRERIEAVLHEAQRSKNWRIKLGAPRVRPPR
jgi:hypothetical protein